ncbi:MAG: hypothetical protein ACKVP0_26115 [Pirellulaceae bacterium]
MKDREQRSSGMGCVLVGAVVVLLVVLYVLGIGPASWIAERIPSTEEFLECVYLPVMFAADCCDPFSMALDWYLEFWNPHAPYYPPGVSL